MCREHVSADGIAVKRAVEQTRVVKNLGIPDNGLDVPLPVPIGHHAGVVDNKPSVEMRDKSLDSSWVLQLRLPRF